MSIGTLAQLSSTSAQLDGSIQVAANGNYVGNAAVWTGAANAAALGTEASTCTPAGGTPWTETSSSVKGWYGKSYNTDGHFFYDGTFDCSNGLNLLCLQQ